MFCLLYLQYFVTQKTLSCKWSHRLKNCKLILRCYKTLCKDEFCFFLKHLLSVRRLWLNEGVYMCIC